MNRLARYNIPPSKKIAEKFAYVKFLLYLCSRFVKTILLKIIKQQIKWQKRKKSS